MFEIFDLPSDIFNSNFFNELISTERFINFYSFTKLVLYCSFLSVNAFIKSIKTQSYIDILNFYNTITEKNEEVGLKLSKYRLLWKYFSNCMVIKL